MREWLRGWWSWHIDAVYFLNGMSYDLYCEVFDSVQDVFKPERVMIAPEAKAECWASGAHDELRFCPDCGWVNPNTVTMGAGMAER